jgi:hypothetical protein
MGPLPEEVNVEVGEDAVEGVRVFLLPAMALVVFDLDPVGKRNFPIGEDRLEDACGMKPSHLRAEILFVRECEHEGAGRIGKDGPDGDRFSRSQRYDVRPENRERVPVPGLCESLDVFLTNGSWHVVHCNV